MQHLIPFRRVWILLFLVLQSCVKDVDIDQYEEIVVPPVVALDLIYFQLSPENFLDAIGDIQPARDEVRLEFLDDDYIQDGLVGADFNFVFYNTFSQGFTVTVKFQAPNNSVQHQFLIQVPPGKPGTPAVANYTEVIPRGEIGSIKRSIKLSVEVAMKSNSQPVDGSLRLESKAFYKFEFK